MPDLHYSDALAYFPPAFEANQRRIECAGVLAQVEAIRAGAGICILHDYAARPDSSLVRLLPDTTFRRTYHLVAHEDTRRLARVDEVYRFIVDLVAAEAPLFAA